MSDSVIRSYVKQPVKYSSPLTGEGSGGGGSNSNKLINLAKTLRKRPTEAEKLLWKHLKLKQMKGLKFRRQQPIDNYIVDFVCLEKRIVIELDGGHHAEQTEMDTKRDLYLKKQGFVILRFWNNDVYQNIEGVLDIIIQNCSNHPPLNPLQSREGIFTSPK